MAAKLGFEAIQYVLKKELTKKGVKGIPTIPGKAYDMRMKQLVDAMADKMRKIGYDVNNVTEKQVKGLLDYGEAMEKQKLKNIESKFFDPSGKMKPAGEDIMKKGLEGLGKKKDPFIGFKPKIVPKETEAQVKARLLKTQKETLERLRNKKKPPEEPEFASGGIAGPLHLYDGGRANYDKGGMSRRKFLQLFGGLASVPIFGKFFKAAKPISKAVAPAAEVVARGADGIPSYAYDLINVVKAKGTKEIIEGIAKRNPPAVKYNYKGVEVVEDGLGNTNVSKKMEETKSWNDPVADDVYVEDVVDREVGFEIKQGEIVKGKDGKPLKAGDEYNESTAYMQGDPEGGIDVSDIAEKIDDVDHLHLKEIADEAVELEDLATGNIFKKAKGGRASYTKGGLAKILGV